MSLLCGSRTPAPEQDHRVGAQALERLRELLSILQPFSDGAFPLFPTPDVGDAQLQRNGIKPWYGEALQEGGEPGLLGQATAFLFPAMLELHGPYQVGDHAGTDEAGP